MSCIKIAAIDLGTVSSRLLCAEVDDGVVISSTKYTEITDLGEGVDATGKFALTAVERVVAACAEFVREARAFGATHVCTTLTSAARDVSNGEDLLCRLRGLGLIPQVIPGEVEARLTFYGVAHDFPGERIAVADSGGGSTELVVGSYTPGEPLMLEGAISFNIGCRRVTERFFAALPPAQNEIAQAKAWMRPAFVDFWDDPNLGSRPERLVAVGGTVTSLVAMVHKLAVYDSHFVHLHELTQEQLADCTASLSLRTVEEIAALPGIQAKRAPVILAGALIIQELMQTGDYAALTVSENSLLAGAAATIYEAITSSSTVIGWMPKLSRLG